MDLSQLLYDKMPKEPVNTGSLLVAEPIMDDTYFSRSVALIVDHPANNSHLGLILNKPLEYTLNDLFPELEDGKNIRIFCGGPVELERLTLLHNLGSDLGTSFEILPGLWVGGEIKKVADYILSGGNTEGKLRFMLGYSGWSPGQLSNEIKGNSWAVNNHRSAEGLLQLEGIEFWRREVKELGDNFRSWLMVPPHPSYN